MKREGKQFQIRDYRRVEDSWELVKDATPGRDTRERPWYQAAKNAGEQFWTETYLFLGEDGTPEAPGVTLATPVYAKDRNLVGVLTADINFTALSKFLKQLKVGKNGQAFIIELRGNGERRLIAHANDQILTRAIKSEKGKTTYRAVSVQMAKDRLVRSFASQLPKSIDRADGHEVHKLAFDSAGESYLGGYNLLQKSQRAPWVIGLTLPEEEVVGSINRANRIAILIAIVSGLIVIVVAVYLSKRIAKAINKLVDETEEIAQFRLEPKEPVESRLCEIHRLGEAFQNMRTGLRSFQKYVPADLVRELMSAGKEAELGGQRSELSIYFSDIADFTSLSEKLSPEELVHVLGEYLSEMSHTILDKKGTIDKYIGDAIMAFWGAPNPCPTHPLEACRTALENQHRLIRLREKWVAEGLPEIHARIGIHTGEVFVGNIGSDTRLDYTVIGDAVNLASRLEGLNKQFGTEIIISEATYEQVKQFVVARPLDRIAVKGKEEGILVYELLGLKGAVSPSTNRLVELCSEAVPIYFNRDWTRASHLLEEALDVCPDDAPAKLLLDRCQEYQSSPPPEAWDGVHRMTVK